MKSLKTLKELQKALEPQASSTNFATTLRIKDGESVRIRILQELTEDAKNFNIERGVAGQFQIHQSPINWKKSARCTTETEGKCFGCEMFVQDNGWKPLLRVLLNVAVQRGDSWEQEVLEMKGSKNSIIHGLMEAAEEFGSITDRTWKYSRTGSGAKDTKYNLLPLAEGKEDAEIATWEMLDLSTAVFTKAYVDQKDYYLEEPEGNSWA